MLAFKPINQVAVASSQTYWYETRELLQKLQLSEADTFKYVSECLKLLKFLFIFHLQKLNKYINVGIKNQGNVEMLKKICLQQSEFSYQHSGLAGGSFLTVP